MSGNTPLATVDPELIHLIQEEKKRQVNGLEMIASENFTSRAVTEAIGSCLTNKYSEGLPGKRYYGGNEIIDKVENLAKSRAIQAFGLDAEKWGVNVQPYSGSPANFAAYTAILKPQDRIMGLDLPSGGHLTHGYQTEKKKISATSIYFESRPYQVNETGYIDYDRLEQIADEFKPNLLICGASAYPRDWDYARLKHVADKHNAWLLCDMAHISGLVAAGEAKSPFEFCDIVTTTTHKTLRGPRSGMIFFRKGKRVQNGVESDYQLEDAVNNAVFPSLQGGPHENVIAGVAVALKEVCQPEWKEYAKNIKKNAAKLANELIAKGYKLITNGTENHLVLWDLRPQGLTGSKMEKVCELASISVNKNAVFGDTSALAPGGIRIGTPALTARGFGEKEMVQIAEFFDRAIKICVDIQSRVGKQLKDFVPEVEKSEEVKKLREDVEKLASSFPMPGLENH